MRSKVYALVAGVTPIFLVSACGSFSFAVNENDNNSSSYVPGAVFDHLQLVSSGSVNPQVGSTSTPGISVAALDSKGIPYTGGAITLAIQSMDAPSSRIVGSARKILPASGLLNFPLQFGYESLQNSFKILSIAYTIPDLAVTGNTSLTVKKKLTAVGNGSWAAGVDYSVAGYDGIVAGDFNNDGKIDLISYGSGNLSFLAGVGNGTFLAASSTTIESGVVGMAVADLNGDGKLDLVTTTGLTTGIVSVRLGNGDGTFGLPTNYGPFSLAPKALLIADFNGDGRPDLAIGQAAGVELIYLGQGDGTFHLASGPYYAEDSVNSMVAADFNNDGILDIAGATDDGSLGSLLLGKGDGTFKAEQDILAPPSSTIRAADLNGDGNMDLIFGGNSSTNTVSVLLGHGDGTFDNPVAYACPSGASVNTFVTGDFDGDGKLDIITANRSTSSLYFLKGNGDGTFQTAVALTTSLTATGIVVSDFNGDGRLDLGISKAGPKASVLIGN